MTPLTITFQSCDFVSVSDPILLTLVKRDLTFQSNPRASNMDKDPTPCDQVS